MPAEGGLPLPKALAGTSGPKIENTWCFDTGASQGIMIPEDDYPTLQGLTKSISAGNGTVTFNLYSDIEVAPGKFMRHTFFTDTAPIVSTGQLNQ